MSEKKPAESLDDRRRRAMDNLARDIKDTGMTSEQAHRKAAEIARTTDRKKTEGGDR